MMNCKAFRITLFVGLLMGMAACNNTPPPKAVLGMDRDIKRYQEYQRLSDDENLNQGKELITPHSTLDDLMNASIHFACIRESSPLYSVANSLGTSARKRADNGQYAPHKDAAAIRERMQEEFRKCIAGANPELNYIQSQVTKAKKGYALWAVHDLFTSGSLSIGPNAKIIEDWALEHSDELKDADIITAGLKSRNGVLGSSYITVRGLISIPHLDP